MFVEPSPKMAIAASSVPRDPGGQRRAGGDRHAGADDGECRQQPDRHVAEVHRPADAADAADRAAADLAEHALRSDAERQRRAVAAIGARDDVGRPGGDGDADGHRLLSVGQMGRAADVPVVVQRLDVLLDAPDLDHPGELLDAALLQRGAPIDGGLGRVLGHDFSSRAHHGAGGRPVSIS